MVVVKVIVLIKTKRNNRWIWKCFYVLECVAHYEIKNGENKTHVGHFLTLLCKCISLTPNYWAKNCGISASNRVFGDVDGNVSFQLTPLFEWLIIGATTKGISIIVNIRMCLQNHKKLKQFLTEHTRSFSRLWKIKCCFRLVALWENF